MSAKSDRLLDESVAAFAAAWTRMDGVRGSEMLRQSLAEGLHALTCEVVAAVEHPAEADRGLLLAMTADRGEMMERRRRGIFAAAPELSPEGRLELIHLTSLFERTVWLLRQLVQSLPGEPAGRAG